MSAPFFGLIKNRFKYRLFLLANLPAAYFSGVQIKDINGQQCSVRIRYRWFTKNPFRSTYFACLSMAAEMSTGALAMAHIWGRKPAVSMLVVESKAQFYKKAIGATVFNCLQGDEIKRAVGEAIQSNMPQTVTVQSEGVNEKGEVIALFAFTWSFRKK